MMEIPYRIEHLPGILNSFADLISRLRDPPKDRVPIPAEERVDDDDTEETTTRSPLMERIVVSAVRLKHYLCTVWDEDWVQPTIGMIREHIGKDGRANATFAREAETAGGEFDYEERVWKKDGKVIIPDIETLRPMLFVMAHGGASGHRGRETTIRTLESVVLWENMNKDVNKFIGECIHCKEKSSHEVPRPFQIFFRHATRSFRLPLHWPQRGRLRASASCDRQVDQFIRLYLAKVDRSLLNWMSTYGVALGPLKNETLQHLCERWE